MGRWQREGEILVGRIGYEAPTFAELWDDGLGDFTEASRRSGLISPFAIDLSTLRVAYQIRGRDIRPTSFTGALQALMNDASPTERWRVRRELQAIAFNDWVEKVDRVIALRLSLERPNPNYRDRQKIKDLIEGTNARTAEVIVRAGDDDAQGIDLSDPLIQQGIDHVEHKYGSYVATAEHGDEQTTWASEHEGAAEIHVVPADPVTRDVSAMELRRALGDATVEQEAFEAARDAIAEAMAEAMASEDAGLLDDVDRDIEDVADLDDDA